MKIVIPGGTGFLGQLLVNSLLSEDHEIVVFSRSGTHSSQARLVPWDACTLGEWAREIDGADVVINLTGKSVKCLYTDKVLKILRDSRVNSTRVVGQAIKQAKKPPKVWIQMSTAAIYAHSFDTPNDEENGKIGEEPHIPAVWKKIVHLVQDWEEALFSLSTDQTRKVVVRCGVVMGLKEGSAFDIFLKLSRWGLGGTIASGKQMVSWVHETDFVTAIKFLMQNNTIKGPVNICSPYPVPQKEFMRILREEVGVKFSLPAPRWMIELSSYLIGIDSELSLKSRYVIPKVLSDNKYLFQFPQWEEAAKDLVAKWKEIRKTNESNK